MQYLQLHDYTYYDVIQFMDELSNTIKLRSTINQVFYNIFFT